MQHKLPFLKTLVLSHEISHDLRFKKCTRLNSFKSTVFIITIVQKNLSGTTRLTTEVNNYACKKTVIWKKHNCLRMIYVYIGK